MELQAVQLQVSNVYTSRFFGVARLRLGSRLTPARELGAMASGTAGAHGLFHLLGLAREPMAALVVICTGA